MKKFRLTVDHIKLLRHMWVGWGYSETGAPEIDPKRPYGNSDVNGDIHKILTGEDLSPDSDVDYYELHRQTETALQIVLRVGKFEPGVYVCDTYRSNWRLESSENLKSAEHRGSGLLHYPEILNAEERIAACIENELYHGGNHMAAATAIVRDINLGYIKV